MFFKKNILKLYRQKLKRFKTNYENKIQEERNKFISILNHDIKTPILAQNQSLKMLLDDISNNKNNKQKEILEEIYYSNNFLLEVISNSIFLAKYENEKPKLNLEKVNIIEQIQDCCELIQNQLNQKQQHIIIKTNKMEDIKLNADRKLIQKIIYNILSGSVSFGFENSDIEVLIKENQNSVSFLTKNKSIYMSKQKIDSLLNNKKNVKDFNQLGMHLNLNIAKILINAHRWKIIAKSHHNNSSVFGFVVKK